MTDEQMTDALLAEARDELIVRLCKALAEDCRGCTDVADLTARLAEAVDCLGAVMAHDVSDRNYVRDIVPPDMQKRTDAIINRAHALEAT